MHIGKGKRGVKWETEAGIERTDRQTDRKGEGRWEGTGAYDEVLYHHHTSLP